jgi:hypothetical protein
MPPAARGATVDPDGWTRCRARSARRGVLRARGDPLAARHLEPPTTPEEGHHLTEDLADRAISRVRQQKALMIAMARQ